MSTPLACRRLLRKRAVHIEPLEQRQLLSAALADNSPAIFDVKQPAGGPASSMRAHPSTIPAAGVVSVLNNGPSSNRVDLSIVGDGFTKSQLSLYASDVQTFLHGFFNEAPLSSYKSFFNVYQVNVISGVSGVSNDPNVGVTRNTPLSMSYWTNGIERLLGIDTYTAKQYAQNAPDDQTIAIANSSKYGGAGYESDNVLTFAGGNASAVEIVKHEFGHSFGNLADEYDYGGPSTWNQGEPPQADVSTYSSAQMLARHAKWWRWIGVDGVGAYEGADYSQQGIYRPTETSKMRVLGMPYGPVDTEQLIEKMYETVHPIDSATAAGSYSASTKFYVKPLEPSDHPDAVQWYIDGKAVAGAKGTTFNPGSVALSPGQHALSVKVEDMTSAVRDEPFRSQHMTAQRQWTINVGRPPADISPPAAVYRGGSLTMGSGYYRFGVTYSDNVAVKASTIDSLDIRVTGRGYSQAATLVSQSSSTDASSVSAVYQISAPGGTWDAADDGDYAISLQSAQIADTAGNYAAGTMLGTLNVTGAATTTVAGTVFIDHNGDGAQQTGDSGIRGISVYIDLNHNGLLDSGEPQMATDGSGRYSIAVSPGMYRVREVLPAGYTISSPSRGFYDITLSAGQNLAGKNFADVQHPAPSEPPVMPTAEVAMANGANQDVGIGDVIVSLNEEGKKVRKLSPFA